MELLADSSMNGETVEIICGEKNEEEEDIDILRYVVASDGGLDNFRGAIK